MKEQTKVVGGAYFLMAVAIVVLLLMSGCRTEYYESGKVKSEGWNLGTQGLGSYSIISIHATEPKED